MADNLSKALADKGWTVIPFPNSTFKLMTLVFEQGGARGHANDFEFLAPGVAPRLLPAEPIDLLPDLSGDRTATHDISIGLSILSGLISALGGGTLGLKAGFKQTQKVTFAYSDLEGASISPVGLQQALNSVALPSTGLLRDWLDDHLYVATAVLSARKISIESTTSAGQEIGLDVPVLSNAVGANLKVTTGNASNSKVVFESARAAPIALQLFKVVKAKINGQPRLSLATVKQGGVEIRAVADTNGLTSGEVPFFDKDDLGMQGADVPTTIVLSWDP